MAASDKTTKRRISLAIDAGSPPSPIDTNNWTLCRRTGRSHPNLLMIAALLQGDYVSFLESLGYDPRADPTFNLDNSYWRYMCTFIKWYIKAFDAKLVEIEEALNNNSPLTNIKPLLVIIEEV